MKFIKEHGIHRFVEQQKKRMAMLETMIQRFDDGRSRSFYCRAAALLDVTSLRGAIAEAGRKIQTDKVKQNDGKTKAKTLKALLGEIAPEAGRNGRARRKGSSL